MKSLPWIMFALKPTFALDDFGTNAPWPEAVAEVVSKRSQFMSKISLVEDDGISKSGRLLLYFPDENLADGAAEYSSNGFF